MNHSLLAIADMPLEETEVLLIVVLATVMLLSARIVNRLRRDLDFQRSKLREQADLNAKLEQMVEKVLRIDAGGGIDSNRPKKK